MEANAAIVRARFGDFHESAGGKALSRTGNTPPEVPERLANVWVHHAFAPGWVASAGWRYVGERYADNANTLVMPSYAVTDASLRWRVHAQTELTLRAANLFDKRYFSSAYYVPTQWLYGPDRKVDLILNHRF